MTARVLRALAVTLLCSLALLVGASPAFAHTRLQSSNPAEGASTDTAPTSVSLTFNEPVQPGFATLTLIGPDGVAYQSGPVTADGDTVSTEVTPLGPAGNYEIGYRVVSEDGHPVAGSVAFTLSTAGPAAATPTSSPAPTQAAAVPATTQPAPVAAVAPTGDGGSPVWPWIVGAVVLLGGGVVAAMRLGRG
jgi:methionine-rich copper-binding protein CopC